MSQNSESGTRPLTHNMYLEITLAQGESSCAIKGLTRILKKGRFPSKPFNITVIQVYVPTSNAEEAEVKRFYEDLQDLLELTPKKMSFSL